jgi:hypothetical protein
MKRKAAAIVLSAAMVLSMTACGSTGSGTSSSASASGGASGDVASADASGDASGDAGAGGGGGMMGGSSEPADLSGLISLADYVVESTDTEVSFDYYGMFEANNDASGDAEFVLGDKDPDQIKVYADRDLTTEADGITAKIDGDKLTVSGLSGSDNTVLYLSTGEDAYTTVVYVVADETDTSYSKKLNDGTSIDLSEYAPTNESSQVYIGGNQDLMDVEDFEDLEDLSDEDKGVADWWLHAGITNSGTTMHSFGDTLYRFELSVALYREFQIVVDVNTTADGFIDPTDSVGAMGGNDQYSDSISANLYAGVFNGLYTEEDEDGKLVNIDGVTEIGTSEPVDEEYLMAAVYNALVSPFASLNEEGQKVAEELAEKNAYTDNEKEAALKDVIGITYGEYSTDKLNALSVLQQVEKYVTQKDSPDADFQEKVQTDPSSDMGSVISDTAALVVNEDTTYTDESLATDEPTALYVTDGTVKLQNSLVASSGDNTEAASILGIESGMPAMPTKGHNMTAANAYYRDGIGAVLPAWGHNTKVYLSTTDGELMVDGPSGSASMAGALFNAFGAAINVDGGVVFTQGQHMSNTVYNGTLHYDGTAVLNPNGRQFSSDFWGGNIVFENAVAEGGFVSDEPTTVINKNSVLKYGNGGSINGYACMYYENSYIENANYTFQDNTSLITDTGSLILVNSVLNGDSIGTVTRSEKAVIKLVDSTLNLNTGTILSIDDNLGAPISMDDEIFHDMFAAEAAIEIYGDVTINVPEKANFSVTSADGDEQITLYASKIDGELDDSNINVVLDDSYGVLHIVQK